MNNADTPSPGIGSRRRGIILLVDDEETLLAALDRQFRSAGLYPILVGDIAAADRVLESWIVHCVVADERLGEDSGAEFLVDIGRRYPGVGRVLLTAFLDGYLEQRAREHEFVALDKACSFAELLDAVNSEIANGGARGA